MNKESYLCELERLLKRLPKEEREDALRWYEEYFEEAGEEKALKTLGSPKEAAREILGKLALNDDEKKRPGLWALMVMALPVAAPVGIALAAVAFALIVSLAAVMFALAVSGIAVALMGIVNVAYVFISGFRPFANALFYIGCGLLLAGIGGAIGYLSLTAMRAAINGVKRLIGKRMIGRERQ